MHDSAKYLIHADVRASGVVERSDVVGAVFGQTEGLLGDGLDLRDLQESGKLGRIDVTVESERGSSFGEITIASGLDRVETAILAAALESIERVGPCRADVEVANIEDVRSAKRRQVVERAKELLAEFDDTAMSSDELVEEVRQSARIENVTEYRGLPAGPRVADSDAVVVVEGRSDVATLLRYGVKNAVAVEGTDVPDVVADLTSDRTVTAFLDGDRAGDLILEELAQVGDVDYVAIAPSDRSVEDLTREEVLGALRDKVPFEAVSGDRTGDADASERAATDGSTRPAPSDATADPHPDALAAESPDGPDQLEDVARADSTRRADDDQSAVDGRSADTEQAPSGDSDRNGATEAGAGTAVGARAGDDASTDRLDAPDSSVAGAGDTMSTDTEPDDLSAGAAEPGASEPVETGTSPDAEGEQLEDANGHDDGSEEARAPATLAGHVDAVVGEGSGAVRFLDAEFDVFDEAAAGEAFEALEATEEVPATVVLDGELGQRLLDLAAQRGVPRVVAAAEGEFVKQPTDVRIRLAEEF